MTGDGLAEAAEMLAGASALLVCAGAGMGVDSGLPDFRGDEGFWRAYPPYARLGLSFAELADPRHFAEDPELAWGFYGHRLDLYRRTAPHAGFGLLLRFGSGLPGGAAVFTSNVDGQFQAAGFGLVAEAHGSIHHLQCTIPCGPAIWPAGELSLDIDESTMRARPPLPSCPDCGAPARPNILMFGDFDWLSERTDAQMRTLDEWRRANRRAVVVEVGAGRAVPTVRRYAELASAATGALIRINPREPEVRHGRGVSLPYPALPALTALLGG
ncbi:SIR2 family NAD-dependent protein deacylase [Amycolatopsis granulosa]|uniref:SIR2 family NAD-dependent protein deacylase n=1 Tax=Amycolatopsis granulosa TaxID=185684 RepID=UPI00141FA071|nr:Sir2 family NAD-dependent protein deacetylase [Amycolatopsis granulosa]NIH86798.1 NAD-dependent SIR2 family protein deacetylase [Amycolatopsis granulosa]